MPCSWRFYNHFSSFFIFYSFWREANFSASSLRSLYRELWLPTELSRAPPLLALLHLFFIEADYCTLPLI